MASTPRIILYRGWLDTTYVWSPFVTKLEARMRFARLSYKNEAGSPRTAPRGKLPYIQMTHSSQEPEMLADSSYIISRLIKDGLVPDLNKDLSPVEKAHDMAIRALLEEKLYFFYGIPSSAGYEKWHENYYTMREKALQALPYPIRILVGILAYRKNMATAYGQGSGRFTGAEQNAFKQEIWSNITALLVDSRQARGKNNDCFWVMGGDNPTEADATLFGFIVGALGCDAAPTSRKIVRKFPLLEEYARKIHEEYFPDYDCWE